MAMKKEKKGAGRKAKARRRAASKPKRGPSKRVGLSLGGGIGGIGGIQRPGSGRRP